jgi:hypothetical protein
VLYPLSYGGRDLSKQASEKPIGTPHGSWPRTNRWHRGVGDRCRHARDRRARIRPRESLRS